MKKLFFTGITVSLLLTAGAFWFTSVSAQKAGDSPNTTTVTAEKSCCGSDSCAKDGCCKGDSCAKNTSEKTAMAAMPGMGAKTGEGDKMTGGSCCGDSCTMGKGKDGAQPATAAMPGMAMATAKAGDGDKGMTNCCCGDSCAMGNADGKATGDSMGKDAKGEGMSCCTGESSCCAA